MCKSKFGGHTIKFIKFDLLLEEISLQKGLFWMNILIVSVLLISVNVKTVSLEFENFLLKTCVDIESMDY